MSSLPLLLINISICICSFFSKEKDRALGIGFIQAIQMDLDVEQSLMSMNSLVATQLQEMEMVRQKVYNLEQTQIAIKQR